MQLEINAFVSSLGSDSDWDPNALDQVRETVRSLAENLAALNLGIILEVRDVQRSQTVARIIHADALIR
ncbi:hypothetical protein [Azospirillum rugosum]|uniref:Uncharacterized protein n=1 Tax=Azospirillum rugosum TaxID=416170 RepID=A0ABS4SGU7_9PROT|nr:hypothetical protein [Azospirillum rugosum]MBP2291786.1 hypothetical protein [Azospirillum rugosum]MDQ0524402.1 hypothetical protein [Azospirillum rugosum]